MAVTIQWATLRRISVEEAIPPNVRGIYEPVYMDKTRRYLSSSLRNLNAFCVSRFPMTPGRQECQLNLCGHTSNWSMHE